MKNLFSFPVAGFQELSGEVSNDTDHSHIPLLSCLQMILGTDLHAMEPALTKWSVGGEQVAFPSASLSGAVQRDKGGEANSDPFSATL